MGLVSEHAPFPLTQPVCPFLRAPLAAALPLDSIAARTRSIPGVRRAVCCLSRRQEGPGQGCEVSETRLEILGSKSPAAWGKEGGKGERLESRLLVAAAGVLCCAASGSRPERAGVHVHTPRGTAQHRPLSVGPSPPRAQKSCNGGQTQTAVTCLSEASLAPCRRYYMYAGDPSPLPCFF